MGLPGGDHTGWFDHVESGGVVGVDSPDEHTETEWPGSSLLGVFLDEFGDVPGHILDAGVDVVVELVALGLDPGFVD